MQKIKMTKEAIRNRKIFYDNHKTRYPNYKRTPQEFQKDSKLINWISGWLLPEQFETLAKHFINDNRELAVLSKHSTEVFVYLIRRDYADEGIYKSNMKRKKIPDAVSSLDSLRDLAKMNKGDKNEN